MDEGVFESSPFSGSDSPTTNGNKKNRGKRLIVLLILLIILGALIYGGIKVAGSIFSTPTPIPTPTEVLLPTDTPTPTVDESLTPSLSPKPTAKPTTKPTTAPAVDSVDSATGLDRADISITVQNGSGEAGVAKIMADKLIALGYKIAGTGNADNFDYTNTVIKVTSANSKYLPLLKKDLGGTYTIDASSSADYTGSGDALIIVGKN